MFETMEQAMRLVLLILFKAPATAAPATATTAAAARAA